MLLFSAYLKLTLLHQIINFLVIYLKNCILLSMPLLFFLSCCLSMIWQCSLSFTPWAGPCLPPTLSLPPWLPLIWFYLINFWDIEWKVQFCDPFSSITLRRLVSPDSKHRQSSFVLQILLLLLFQPQSAPLLSCLPGCCKNERKIDQLRSQQGY